MRGATVVEAVAPLLVGGYLNLKALIKGVAEPQSVAQGMFGDPFGMHNHLVPLRPGRAHRVAATKPGWLRLTVTIDLSPG